MKNLNNVVALVAMDREDDSASGYQRYLQYAIHSYKNDLQFRINPAVEVLYATPNDVGIVPMPVDMEKYTKIAVLILGEYYTLTFNPDMPINNRLDSCGDPILDTNNGTCTCNDDGYATLYPWASHWRAGNYVGEMYSKGGGINKAGYYNVDYKNRQFQFSSVPFSEVVIEYISNKVSAQSVIDDAAVDVVRYAVHYQLALFDKKMTQADKERLQRQYLQSAYDYRVMKTLLTPDEFMDIIYRSSSSGVKR